MRKPLLAALSACALVSAAFPSVEAGIRSEEDLLTGQSNHYLSIDSSTTVPNSIGIQKEAILFVRCKANSGLDVFVSTPSYNSDNTRVKLRWEDGKVITKYWVESKSSQALFAREKVSFLKQLTENDRLVFGWTPFSTTEKAVAFDLAAQREDLKKMVELCGVTFKPDKRKGSSSSGSMDPWDL